MEMRVEDIEKIAEAVFSKFQEEFSTFKDSVLEMLDHYVASIKEDISKFNDEMLERIQRQSLRIDQNEAKLDKHDKILENHCVSITNILKDIKMMKNGKDSKPEPKVKVPVKIKLAVVGAITYMVVNLGILVFLIHVLLNGRQ